MENYNFNKEAQREERLGIWDEKIKELRAIDDFYIKLVPPEAKDMQVSVEFPYRTAEHKDYVHNVPFLKVKYLGSFSEEINKNSSEYKELKLRAKQEMDRFTKFLKERFF